MSNNSGMEVWERDVAANADIASKEEAVAQASVAFSASVQQASAAGRGTVQRVVSVARPVLVGAALLAVAGVTIGFVRRRPTKPVFGRLRVPSSSRWTELARAAAVAFAAAAGRRLMERWLRGAEGEVSLATSPRRQVPKPTAAN